MEELKTIQTKEKLNEVYAIGDKGPGNAFHKYEIIPHPTQGEERRRRVGIIVFQKGPREEEGSTPGVIDSDLLEIVRHRLQCFQTSEFKCRENEKALGHIEMALEWLNMRVEDRIERRVLGTDVK